MVKKIKTKTKTIKALNEPQQQIFDFKGLETNGQKYRFLLENTNEAVSVAQDGILKYINPATIKMLGYAKDVILATPFTEFIHPDDRLLVMERHLKRLQGEKIPDTYCFRLIVRDNTVRWVQLRTTFIYWEEQPASINFLIDITVQKLFEDTLRKSEEEKSAILHAMSELVVYLDKNLQVVWSNSAMNSQFNLQAGQIEGKYCYEALHGLQKPCKVCPVSITIATGEPYTVDDFSSLGKRWSMRSYPVKEEGKLVGIVEIATDITDRKQAEEALLESKELYTKLVDTIPDVIVRTDLAGKILFVNDYTLQISGYSRDEIEGQNMLLFIAPEDHDRLLQNSILMMERSLGPKEYQMIMKNGVKIPFEVNADVLRSEDGTPFGLVCVCRSIIERKRAEEALQESEFKYRRLIENTRDLIYTTDKQGFITYLNPTLEKTLGYENKEWIAQSFIKIIAPEYIAAAKDIFQRAMRSESIPVYSTEMIRKDGSRISVEVNVTTLYDQEGKPAGRYGIGRDITDRKRMEEEREHLILELKEALSQVKALSGLLPICAACKKIRNDEGYWEQIEVYIRDHSEAEFSHGICPECVEKFYPGCLDKKK